MAENPAEVSSDSTATDTSATVEGQTGAEPSEQTTTETQPRKSLRDLFKEDPTLEAEFNVERQRDLARARTRWQRQQLREHAKAATEANDPQYSRYVAQQVAAEPDEEADDGETHDANWSQSADRIQPQLERLLQLDAQGQATNPYYVALHKREGRAAMDKRYAADPVEFVNWVDDQIMEMRVDAKLKKVAPSMAAALAQDEAHTRLRNQTAPLGGSNTANGTMTLEGFQSMTFAERAKFRRERPRDYDDIIARAAR